MKKYIIHFVLITIFLFICSCVEESHYIKKNGNGYDIVLKTEMSKSMVRDANDKNGGDLIREYEKGIRKKFGNTVEIERSSVDGNYIITTSFYVDAQSRGGVKKMLPRNKANFLIIPLDYGRDYNKKLEEYFSHGSMFYKLKISKKESFIITKISLKRKNGNTEEYEFREDDDYFVVSIPMERLYIRYPFVEVILTIEEKRDFYAHLLYSDFLAYKKSQIKYFNDNHMIGTCKHVECKDHVREMPNPHVSLFQDLRVNENTDAPYFHSITENVFVDITEDCKETTSWEIRSVIEGGRLCFEVLTPLDSECDVSSQFTQLCQLASSGLCGETCSGYFKLKLR